MEVMVKSFQEKMFSYVFNLLIAAPAAVDQILRDILACFLQENKE